MTADAEQGAHHPVNWWAGAVVLTTQKQGRVNAEFKSERYQEPFAAYPNKAA